ncbi:hypothetical protein ACOSQ2_014147 [Xanthoceras sorbifolium]
MYKDQNPRKREYNWILAEHLSDDPNIVVLCTCLGAACPIELYKIRVELAVMCTPHGQAPPILKCNGSRFHVRSPCIGPSIRTV